MRTFLVALCFLLFFVLLLPLLAFIFILRRIDRKKADWLAYRVVFYFLKLELFVSGAKVEVEGRDNIPDEPCLFVGNHRSYYDVLASYAQMKAPCGYVAKKELSKFPVMAQWMIALNCVFLDRSNLKEGLRAIFAAADIIKDGCSVFIYPEGTRNRTEDKDVPMEFKEGSLKIAQKANCMIVPVASKNTEALWESHFPWVRPATIRISFLKPFSYKDLPEEYKKTPAAYTRLLIAEELKKPL